MKISSRRKEKLPVNEKVSVACLLGESRKIK